MLFVATLSLGLGLFNLLPLPVLDGGHIVYALWEWVTGKRVPSVIQNALQYVGLALLVLLFVLVTYSDILRIFK